MNTFDIMCPYLTFLDIVNLDRKGAVVQSKVDELEMINHKLHERLIK